MKETILTVEQLAFDFKRLQEMGYGKLPVVITLAEYYEGCCGDATDIQVTEVYVNGEWVKGVKFV